MKTLPKLFVFTLLLCLSAMASANSVEIEFDSGLIKGSADAVPLGEVITRLSQKMDFDVYLDAALAETLVSFTIHDDLTPEEAIQRIVRPHSYAMVFQSESDEGEAKIREVWIFREGEQHSTSYIPFKREGTDSEVSENYAEQGTAPVASLSPWTLADQNNRGIGLVRRDLRVHESVLGTPVMRGRDKNKGPDYRLSAHEMHLAYENFRMTKHREGQRAAEITMQHARTDFERKRQVYNSKRNEELKNQILEMKQK